MDIDIAEFFSKLSGIAFFCHFLLEYIKQVIRFNWLVGGRLSFFRWLLCLGRLGGGVNRRFDNYRCCRYRRRRRNLKSFNTGFRWRYRMAMDSSERAFPGHWSESQAIEVGIVAKAVSLTRVQLGSDLTGVLSGLSRKVSHRLSRLWSC